VRVSRRDFGADARRRRGTLFGLLLAFVLIIAYENFLEKSADVSREADSLASLVRDSAAFAELQGDRVRGAVGNICERSSTTGDDARRRRQPSHLDGVG